MLDKPFVFDMVKTSLVIEPAAVSEPVELSLSLRLVSLSNHRSVEILMSPSKIHWGEQPRLVDWNTAPMASAVERPLRKPYELLSALVSVTGSSAIRYNACIARSRTVIELAVTELVEVSKYSWDA